MQLRPDSLTLPDPLRAAEIGTFTHTSVVERLPDIGRRTLAENDFPAPVEDRLYTLFHGIPRAPVRHLTDHHAPDALDWGRWVEEVAGQNWLEVPWFFAENYFYRRILEAMGYFIEGPLHEVDPFLIQKRRGLETAAERIESLAGQLAERIEAGWSEETFARLLTAALWGNQGDLSLWPAGEGESPVDAPESGTDDRIIVNDVEAVLAHMAQRGDDAVRIDVLVDNAGFELVTDLALADYLLTTGAASAVHMHLKMHPTFVSDAMPKDVRAAVGHLLAGGREVGAFGERVRAHLYDGRLVLREDFFWNSPLGLWALPRPIQDEVKQAHLVISKGDAHYRRILGDRHWPFTTPFAAAADYFLPPLLALRTCKSEIVVGLEEGQALHLTAEDADWLTDGAWGLIQFKPATKGLR